MTSGQIFIDVVHREADEPAHTDVAQPAVFDQAFDVPGRGAQQPRYLLFAQQPGRFTRMRTIDSLRLV
ncbi:MAG TPA: hypothetical protein VLR26_08285 [Frankiaceae bacterium]|nr:hypothetical protein [Frankiaceae bacterium]